MKRPKLKLKTARKWAEGEDERLTELALNGQSIQRIAKVMERTESSIRMRAVKLGVSLAEDLSLRSARNLKP